MASLGLGLGLATRRAPAAAGGGGSEFITNGDFAADSDWTKGGGWTIGSGQASYAGGGGGELLSQNFGALVAPLVNGNAYRVSVDILTPVTVNVSLSGGTGTQQTNLLGPGTKTWDVTASDARTTLRFTQVDGDPVSLDNASLVSVP
jgi:hypothetical protein